MMNRHEKWEHERNLDEIVDRISELIASILLMLSLIHISEPTRQVLVSRMPSSA